ncbi:uncharacterized protein LOC124850755 [Scophthalmus maximus]|uniref:uncharacterized protein LOC124850755 n=1 Tax=Scophthalmus maximus TaxID=52904 RepID=UPI001FA8E1C0|nr:uncharacterized protein LOC124850755 [Scophthalmus maximus]
MLLTVLSFSQPTSSASLSSAVSSTVSCATGRRTPSPGHSPRRYVQTVSPLSLPPSPVSSMASTSSVPSAATRVEVSATTSTGSSSAPLPPVTSAPAVASPSIAGPSTHPAPDPLPLAGNVEADAGSAPGWLPAKLLKTIPLQDQKWISAALWKHQRLRSDLKLWYDPPEPALIYHQIPTPERFFNHRLLVWMPYHLWKVRLTCPVCGKHLTGYGAHKRARQVLDIDRYYLLITETLWCSAVGCKTSYISTSKTILDQLDLAHRLEFRVILTQRYACDMRVIRFLRERTLGNSSSRLVKQLRENHSEEWLKQLCRYLGACSDFAARPCLLPVQFQEPPEPVAIPSHRWMLAVYGRDILSRLEHIKASITSTFGSILKMDSTKKITKKLSGLAKGTALWLTSVSNEVGQILISVLTAQEGPALDIMVADLIRRYSNAGVTPPQLLYVDCDCCLEGRGPTKLQQRFGGWPDLVVKLDIYHFMRRLASGCTKDAHPLYPIFMAKLSCCIFEWDSEDVALVRRAKREQLKREGVPGITEKMVDQHITKDELARHCRRRTRGEQQTIVLIECLLNELMGEKGRDLLGVPLLDQERMQHIWQTQRRHVKCIQDEPGVLLYAQTGTTTKEGIILPNYRCARGSTSLESFHLHLNRFIPGTSANGLNFQLYLLEGLKRWNQDRHAASLAVKPPALLTYSGDLVQCVNTHSVKVLGRKLVPSFQPPAVYTGELIGIDYLYRQTGQALQDVHPDSEETDQMLEDVGTEEELEVESFEDSGLSLSLDPTIELLDLSSGPSPDSTSSASLPTPSSLHPTASCSAAAATEQHVIVHEPSGPSALPAGSRLPVVLPTTTRFQATVPPAATAGPSASPPITHAAPQQLPLDVPKRIRSGLSAVTTGSASVRPLLPTTLATTVPAATATAMAGLRAITPAAPEQQQAVDERCVPGMERVDCLAEYLVGLRTETGQTLNNQQASTIIALWQNLLPYDQQRVTYAARHQVRLTSGRFRCSKKKPEFTPGVESMTRCVLGSTGSPAQWPDCCRLVESIFVKLCSIYKSPKKQGKCALTRWTLILRDYSKIRQLVLANGAVMQGTTLQLFDVNQTTLIQWHNKRLKRQDSNILLQGVNLPPAIPVARAPLPPVQIRPAVAPLQPGPQHQYHLPPSTAGQAVVKRKSAAPAHHLHAPKALCPRLPAPRQLFPQPAPPPTSARFPFVIDPSPAIGPIVFLAPQVPAAKSIAPHGPLPTPSPARRPYNRTTDKNKCSQCHQPRNKDNGHGQYYGYIYCPQNANMSLDQWMEEMRRKRAQKK